MGESGEFVSATVVAPASRATVSAWIVSVVRPECEMPIATSPGFRSAAETSARCTSTEQDAEMPMRASFCCRSCAVSPLAPKP